MQITLETPRLQLKSMTPSMIHEVFLTMDDLYLMKLFAVDKQGLVSMQSMVEKGMETFRISTFYFLLIDKNSGETLGDCGFHTWNRTHKRAELFYDIRNESNRNKGFVSEALPTILNYGFNELLLHRVEALVAREYEPSKAILHKFGFVYEGIMREDYCVLGKNEDSLCYSLLRSEWNHSKCPEIIIE